MIPHRRPLFPNMQHVNKTFSVHKVLIVSLIAAAHGLAAQQVRKEAAAVRTNPDITAADLRLRLFAVAHDSMMGRMTGEPGNYKAAEYVASEFKRLGLEPAGENGSYFQVVPFVRASVNDANTSFTIGDDALVLGRDYLPSFARSVSRTFTGARVVYGGNASDTASWPSADSTAGRVVVLSLPVGNDGARRRLGRGILVAIARNPHFARAAAIVFPELDLFGSEQIAAIRAGDTALDTARLNIAPLLLVTPATASRLLGADPATLRAGALGGSVRGAFDFRMRPMDVPARNVVAILRGSDPSLKNQYVALTGHNDHVGYDHSPVDHDSLRAFNRVMRPMGADTPPREATPDETRRIRIILDSLRKLNPPRLDSIRNGADDDGTGTVALLELAERLSSEPRAKRSILFVSHTAEELGLLGSNWYTDHATVSTDSIVASMDMDMIGRGRSEDLPDAGPQYLEVVGLRRVSAEYGDILEAVNARQAQPFVFNLEFDRPGHPLQYYCRADHYNYARYNIPAVAFSRGEHLDYHQVTDEAQYIDYDALARVTRFVHDAALELGNRAARPKLDHAKGDPHVACRQ